MDTNTRLQDSWTTDLSVVLINYNTAQLRNDVIAALESSRCTLNVHVIVVDNASRDESVEILRKKCADGELIENHSNVGFGRANNQALTLARGRYVLLL